VFGLGSAEKRTFHSALSSAPKRIFGTALTQMALSRTHTSAKAADVAKLLTKRRIKYPPKRIMVGSDAV